MIMIFKRKRERKRKKTRMHQRKMLTFFGYFSVFSGKKHFELVVDLTFLFLLRTRDGDQVFYKLLFSLDLKNEIYNKIIDSVVGNLILYLKKKKKDQYIIQLHSFICTYNLLTNYSNSEKLRSLITDQYTCCRANCFMVEKEIYFRLGLALQPNQRAHNLT